jgi:hypothetical protein
MEKNGVLNGQSLYQRLSPETLRKLRAEELDRKELEEQRRTNDALYAGHQAAGQGQVLEDPDYFVDVTGFQGELKDAPDLSTDSRPPTNSAALWVKKLDPGEKGTFLIYSPSFYGVYTHYRSPGTVLCFKDHNLCVGGHDEATRRWHGFLHAFHFEVNKQVFVKITPEAAKALNDQVAEGASLRGLKITYRRSKAKKGPYYIAVTEIMADHSKLPRHRDARASIFRMFRINPTKRMETAALSGGEEDIPTGEG